jgi:hypothetical protein
MGKRLATGFGPQETNLNLDWFLFQFGLLILRECYDAGFNLTG